MLKKTKVLFPLLFVLLIFEIGNSDIIDSLTFSSNNIDTTQDSIFYRIYYDGLSLYCNQEGEPDLPYVIFRYLIPRDEDVDSITVGNIDTSFFGNLLVYPVQGECGTCMEDTLIPEFIDPDSTIYSSQSPFPTNICTLLSNDLYNGSHKIASIGISPLSYVGADTLLYLNCKVRFTLHTSSSNDTGYTVAMRTTLGNKMVRNSLESLIENDDDIDNYAYFPSPDEDALDYLIITRDSLKNYFYCFREWKRDKGYKIDWRTVEWINSNYPGSGDSIKIRNYLRIAHEDSGIIYVLLGGDFQNVPGWGVQPGVAGYNDNKYRDLTSDVGFEIVATRVPVLYKYDVLRWTDKLKQYEKYPGKGNYSYLDRGYLHQADILQHYDFVSRFRTAGFDDLINYTTIDEENCPPLSTTCYPTEPKGTTVLNHINGTTLNPNKHIIGIYGHGNPWAILTKARGNGMTSCMSFVGSESGVDVSSGTHNSYLTNLNNAGYPSLMINGTCGNGMLSFDNYPSEDDIDGPLVNRQLPEIFLFMEDKGGPAYSGGSIQGLTTWDVRNITNFYSELVSDPIYGYAVANGNFNDKMIFYGDPAMYVWHYSNMRELYAEIIDCNTIIVWSCDDEVCYLTGHEGINVSLVDTLGRRYNAIANDAGYVDFDDFDDCLRRSEFSRFTVSYPNYVPITALGKNAFPVADILLYGRYVFFSDCVIHDAVTVIIDPGTEIMLDKLAPWDSSGVDNKIEIIVNGRLEVNGTEDHPVKFMSYLDTNQTASAGDWYGIKVEDGVAKIKNARIEHAYIAVKAGAGADTVDINKTEIYKAQLTGIRAETDNVKIDSCDIDSVGTYAIYLIDNATADVTYNEITMGAQGTYGIFATNVDGQGLNIYRNIIQNPEYGIYLNNSNASTIRRNELSRNGGGIGITINGTAPTIDSCRVTGYEQAVVLSGSNSTFSQNIFDNYIWAFYNDQGGAPSMQNAKNSFRTIPTGPGYYVRNDNQGFTLNADSNWWGIPNPDSTKFIGPISFFPWLNSDPNTGWGKKELITTPLPEKQYLTIFPNPFNLTTTIRYTVPSDARVVLKIFDMTGKKIDILVNAKQHAGEYVVVWDGTNSIGNAVSSGIYLFCLIIDGEEIQTQKAILLK